MAKDLNNGDMSELERELELEMEGDEGSAEEAELEQELDEEWEAEGPEEEFEDVEGESAGDFAERFYELSQREFESESEVDSSLNELFTEMERDLFWGKIRKGFQRLKRKGLGRLLQKGLKLAAGRFPHIKVLQGLTDLSKGNLTGMLKSAAKVALAAHPAGAVALPALKALGFEQAEEPERNREAWDNYVELAREAYDHLAENLTENADNPLEASRLAANAFQTALKKVQAGIPSVNAQRNTVGMGAAQGRRVINLGSGQTIFIRLASGGRIRIKG
ncbi:MAG: hypothetical protein HY695_08395 [Deltaproteobacteria bacterium]|nr:hypothetical protein [Deltaproteobacteria bacterium]